MITIRPSFFEIGRPFLATPGVTAPDEVIDGFPEFAFTTSDPEVQRKLRALARRIVASHRGGSRIIGFEVHGHADATLRPPPGQSAAQTEMEVSIDRADNAKDMLLNLIEEEGGKPIIAGIRANATAKGFGSAHRIFIPAKNEAQMKKNRRVEIFLKVLDPPKPKPQPPAPPPPNPSSFSILIKGGTVMTVGVPLPIDVTPSSVSYSIFVEVVDVKRKQKARFHILATGVGLPGASANPVAGGSAMTITEGSPTQPFSCGPDVTLDRFAGGVEFSQDPGASFSVLTTGGDINFMTFEHVRTNPSVISASNGTGFDTFPNAGLGGIAKGSMRMIGNVQPL